MKFTYKFVAALYLLVCIFVSCSLYVHGEYTIEIRIHNFSNPTSLLANGECCDYNVDAGNNSCTIDGCDSYFHFCLRELGKIGGGCSGGRVSLVNYNQELIDFSLPTVLGLPNPLPLPGLTPDWNGIQLFVQVLEYSPPEIPQLIKEATHDITVDLPLGEESDPVIFTNNNESNQASVALSFRVVCAKNYYGTDCSKLCNANSGCNGNEQCIPGMSNYSCICDPGYSGERCEVDINECELVESPCGEKGVCVDGVNDFSCICDPGFSGKNCTPEIDDCVGVICSGNSECVDGMNNYSCVCNPGFTGEKCDIDIDECETMNITCSGRGKCEDGVHNYTCLCDPGFTGKECELNINDCPDASCSDNGQCMDGINAYTCICNPGFTGEDCDSNVNECEMLNILCSGRGECMDGINDFTCNCNPGFAGKECEINIDDCVSINCSQHGTCIDRINEYTCVCDAGYTGTNCEVDIDECVEMGINCSGQGQCVDNLNGYTCVCNPGFTGEECQVNIDECETENVTCSQHGTCVDDENSYYCVCDQNFTGPTCSIAVVAEGTKDKGQDHFQFELLSGVFIGIVGFGVITVVVLGTMIAVIGHLKRSLRKAKRKNAKAAANNGGENGSNDEASATTPSTTSQNVYSSLQPSNPLTSTTDDRDSWHKVDNPLYRDRSIKDVSQSQQSVVQSEPIFDDAIYNTVVLLSPDNGRSTSSVVLSESDRTDSLEHQFQNPIYGQRNESLDTVQRRLDGLIEDLRYMSAE